MTNEEIKKALKICSDIRNTRANNRYTCDDCPYDDIKNCIGTLLTAAREHITEQENEIERLKNDYSKLQEQFAQYQMASDKEITAQVKQAKIDVLNELKTKAFDKDAFNGWAGSTFVVLVRDIDKMIEELTKCRR